MCGWSGKEAVFEVEEGGDWLWEDEVVCLGLTGCLSRSSRPLEASQGCCGERRLLSYDEVVLVWAVTMVAVGVRRGAG